MRLRRPRRPRPRPKPRPSPQPPAPPAPPPPKLQALVTPEGTRIEVQSAGGWTPDYIYELLKDAGYDARIGRSLKLVRVQDQHGSQTSTSVGSGADGRYSNFAANMYLLGVNSTLQTQPNALVAHEYGHVWSLYHLYLSQQARWDSYLQARGLTGDTRLDSSYVWSRREIIADDYRLLFGGDKAIAQNPGHMNGEIPDPRDVPGLREFLRDAWPAS